MSCFRNNKNFKKRFPVFENLFSFRFFLISTREIFWFKTTSYWDYYLFLILKIKILFAVLSMKI